MGCWTLERLPTIVVGVPVLKGEEPPSNVPLNVPLNPVQTPGVQGAQRARRVPRVAGQAGLEP